MVKHFLGPAATVESEFMHGFEKSPKFVIVDVDDSLPLVVRQRLSSHYAGPVLIGPYAIFERK